MTAEKESFAQMLASGGKWLCFVPFFSTLENEKAVNGGTPLKCKAGLLFEFI